MKKFLYVAVLAPLFILSFSSCDKDSNSVTPEPKRWVKVYKDVILANETYTGQGQFLNTKTGAVVKLSNADASVRKQLALMCFISSGGNYVYLTAPGSLGGAVLNSDHDRQYFTAMPNGIDNWAPTELNSSELRPVAGGLTASGFDNLAATATWTSFNDAFRENNNGDADLSFTLSYEFAGSGDIFLIQINDALRIILKATAVNNDPQNGFIRADLIVEGREDMASGGVDLMPAE